MKLKRVLSVVLTFTAVSSAVFIYLYLYGKGPFISDIYLSSAERARAASLDLKAAYLYGEALERYEKNAAARKGLFELYLKNGDFGPAEQLYMEGIRIDGGHADFYAGISMLYVKEGNALKAAEFLNNIKNEYVKTRIGGLRPEPPGFSLVPGKYNELLPVNAEPKDKASSVFLYYLDEDRSLKPAFDNPFKLKKGTNTLYAISVSKDGVASDLSYAEYNVERVLEKVSFKDPTVEEITRKALNKPSGDIMSDELWDIVKLSNISDDGSKTGREIKTFSDFEYFTGLKELTLSGLNFDDSLETLTESLKDLTSLTLSGCSLDSNSAGALKGITGLKQLDLSSNNISDITFLSNLIGLNYLVLKDNRIDNLSPVLNLRSVSYLDVSGNELENIEPIEGLADLRTLIASSNRIVSLKPIAQSASLESVDISNNNLNSLDGIEGLKTIKTLIISDNKITDLKPVSGLVSLKVLDAKNNMITGLSPVSGLGSLVSLNLSQNAICDLSPLKNLKNIKELVLRDNQITDLSPVSGLLNLLMLNVEENPVKDFSPLLKCLKLATVFSSQGGKNTNDASLVSGAVKGIPAD